MQKINDYKIHIIEKELIGANGFTFRPSKESYYIIINSLLENEEKNKILKQQVEDINNNSPQEYFYNF